MGKLQDEITQLWVKLTGRRIDPTKDSWLVGPHGDTDLIQDKFIHSLAEKEDLEIAHTLPGSGLLPSITDIGISEADKQRLHPAITDFYEHTSNYDFEIWSEWTGFFRPFGWLLSILFSKRLQQLNLPLSAIDSSKGLKSEIIQLRRKSDKAVVWTVWYRKLKSSGDVIYSGVYTYCNNPNYEQQLLKVVFPLPNGNASVVMTANVQPDGSLLLSSDGKQFGDNGFYFTLTDHKGKHWARFVRSMHEWIHVYVDDENSLRTNHNLFFYGLQFLKLHYKMRRNA